MGSFCRDESWGVGEPISGSAVAHTDVWLALEHDQPWAAKAVAQSGLPSPVIERLQQWAQQIAGARVQLIRGTSEVSRPGLTTLLVGVSCLQRPSVVRLSLPSHRAVLEIDAPAVVAALRAGSRVPDATPVKQPVVLVCTNGKRDRCCAKWGMPLYTALSRFGGIECWQTTHLGGHRFAPTLLSLPDGLCYGRVQADDLAPLVDALRADELFAPDRVLRGRTCISGAAQAAEAHWRAESGVLRSGALVGVREAQQGTRIAVTLTLDTGATITRIVERRAMQAVAHPSCAKPRAPVSGWFAG